MRDTIFISHATPEDNEFTIWIASRLELLGYKVWIDKEGLLGGERFWKEIDGIIRKKTYKVLLVYSNNICYNNEPGELKTGINKELELAESIATNERLKDFIIPLHIDDSRHDLFVGSNMLTHISFEKNWAEGFDQLLKKLDKDKTPISSNPTNSTIGNWFENEYINKNNIIEKKELYYSSWWSFDEMPDKFYIYVFDNKSQADSVYKTSEIPIGRISNVLTTFENKLCTDIQRDDELIKIIPKEKHQISLSMLLFGFEADKFPTHRDTENHFKKLLNQCFFQLMRQNRLFWYKLANKKFAYFYVPSTLDNHKIKFEYPYRGNRRKKTKSLFGKYKSLGNWHYAISAKPSLFPFIGFDLKSHIIFTKNGYETWDEKDKMHSQRRAKGRRFFNEEWRDMQLAFIQGMKRSNGKISVEIANDKLLVLREWPEMYWADFGYIEPKNKNQHDILNEYYIEEE